MTHTNGSPSFCSHPATPLGSKNLREAFGPGSQFPIVSEEALAWATCNVSSRHGR